jgi:ferredoxin--NADP+ reductase
MPVGDNAVECLVTWRRDWAPHLFSFRTIRPAGIDFAPGQFVRLGIAGDDGAMVWRAYSIASSPADEHLEFYSIVVPDGPFTQPLAKIEVGDSIRIDPIVYGFLRTDRFEGGRHLWLLATGTGVAPFRSMLADGAIWSRYEAIVLVHSVRTRPELAYHEDFHAAANNPPPGGATFHYVPALTANEGTPASVPHGRITTRLADGSLERMLDLAITTADSRLMICGNPSMIQETRAILGVRGLTPVRRDVPGQFIVENFW